jgi:hypothetical protein
MKTTIVTADSRVAFPVAAIRHPSLSGKTVDILSDCRVIGRNLSADTLREGMSQFRQLFALHNDPRDDMADDIVAAIVADEMGWGEDDEQLFVRLACLVRSNTPEQLLGYVRYSIACSAAA